MVPRMLVFTAVSLTLAAGASAQPPAPAAPGKAVAEKTFTLDLDKAPWAAALDWYASQSGLTLVATTRPMGNVTIRPGAGRKLTLAEVTDLFNEALVQQRFLLVRFEKSFTVWPTDERIDPTRLPRVEEADLPRRGKTELVLCTVGPFRGVAAKEAVPQVERMLSPVGRAVLLDTTDRIQLADTAGNIDRILRALPARVPPAAKK
jgi:type II secretory pathway component GspD/PulD (secretin)